MRGVAVGLMLGLGAGALGGRLLWPAAPATAAPPTARGAGSDATTGTCACPPAEAGSATASAPAQRLEVRPAAARPSAGDAPLDSDPPAGATTEVLRAENAHLREELIALSRRYDDAQAELKETYGEPLPFPKDLPPRFGEPALREAFTQAMAQVGAVGRIESIDCTEFPCIVYGEVDTRAHREALEQAPALAPYKGDARSLNAWSSTVKDAGGQPRERQQFGLAIFPRTEDKAQREAVGKRLKYRNEQVYEAMRPDDAE